MDNTNRLIDSNSPYLLQHAHNPVDWYPWGPEALAKSKSEDKPILVSIGYSSCHWCHVMERESFENEEIAKFMNQHFVCIKVDREERPDIDQIYMDAAQALGAQGGWPLNVFITPGLKPFYGGTYFPPTQFKSLLTRISEVFKTHRQELLDSADQVTKSISISDVERFGLMAEEKINKEKLSLIRNKLAGSFDKEYGGMKRSPKFPMPGTWNLLMYLSFVLKDDELSRHLNLTLNKMAMGGIYDQVGGGFARYSTDERWFAPHFEKMLYDNGQLMSLYAEAFSFTGNEYFKEVIYETKDWLQREMIHSSGGFYSALDADSEGIEGKYYVWSSEEFYSVLGSEYEILGKYFGITKEGNWEVGKNILHLTENSDSFAQKNNLSNGEFKKKIKQAKEILLAERYKRIRPTLDDKILCSWNALMSCGLIDAYEATGDDSFIQIAIKNAQFLTTKMVVKNKVYRSWKNESAYIEGFLDDYSFLIKMLLKLYQATFDEKWLSEAMEIQEIAIKNFEDPQESFFYYTQQTDDIIARKKEILDNVIPSSNSVMAHNLYSLGLIMGNSAYLEKAKEMVSRISSLIEVEPEYSSHWALLYSFVCNSPIEVAISGPGYLSLRKELAADYFPNKVVCGAEFSSELPLLKGREAKSNKSLIYICQNHSCKLPVETVTEAKIVMIEVQ